MTWLIILELANQTQSVVWRLNHRSRNVFCCLTCFHLILYDLPPAFVCTAPSPQDAYQRRAGEQQVSAATVIAVDDTLSRQYRGNSQLRCAVLHTHVPC